jgi:AcrR family transcriptional regulator
MMPMLDEGSGSVGSRGGGEADAPDEPSDERRIQQLLIRELGPEMAEAFVFAREAQERWERRRHPNAGLRERKKRRTRQQISDVATSLFVVRGFDRVKVSEIAAIVGVSEKTVYNYFPTKESLVFDRADDGVARLAAALRERAPGESPTKAMLRALDEDMTDLEDLPDEIYALEAMFADLDPRDPEPLIAARAIVALQELAFASRMRHVEEGLRGKELHAAVSDDLERAARLLDAGLWSFNLLTQGARTRQQLREAAAAAEDVRRQVLDALEQARAAWRALRGRERQA